MPKAIDKTDVKRTSIRGLARVLTLSLPTIKKYLRAPGAPQPGADKLYSVDRVKEFITQQKGGGAEIQSAKAERAQLDLEMARLEYQRKIREVVPVAEVYSVLGPLITELDEIIKQELEVNLAVMVRGKSAAEITAIGASIRDRIAHRFKTGVSSISEQQKP